MRGTSIMSAREMTSCNWNRWSLTLNINSPPLNCTAHRWRAKAPEVHLKLMDEIFFFTLNVYTRAARQGEGSLLAANACHRCMLAAAWRNNWMPKCSLNWHMEKNSYFLRFLRFSVIFLFCCSEEPQILKTQIPV